MVTFQNKGLIDVHGIDTFGVCVKPATNNPIGYFGTGLKYAIAVLMRENQKLTMHLGEWRCTFDVKKHNIRGEAFDIVRMNGKELPFTTELGKNWELWMAYRELYANTIDEEDAVVTDGEIPPHTECTTFVVEGDAFDVIHEQHGQIFLETEPRHTLEGLEIHDDLDAGNWIYYRGIRVYELPKRAMYNYNLTEKLKLTEDRTIGSISDVHMAIAKAIVKCDDVALIRQMLLADSRFFESTIDYHWWVVRPGETFNKVIERYMGGGTSFNTSARDLYKRDHPEEDAPDIIQMETIPMEQRRKLWAALLFWDRLGMSIPRGIVHVTTDLEQKRGKALRGHIYLSKFVLEMDMRAITGLVYKLYAHTRPTIGDVKQEDLLIDTVVDFGERILGVQPQQQKNVA